MRRDFMNKVYNIFVLTVIMVFATSCNERIFIYYHPGPFQVLGNDKELYFFLDINRIAKRGYSVSDAPTTYPVGHIQDILVINKDGLLKKIHVNIDQAKGITFHPNNTRIFRYDNQLYVYSGEAQTSYDSIFKWNEQKQQFIILPLKKTNALLQKFGISKSLNFGERQDVVFDLSKKSGWDFYFSQTAMNDDNFKWNGLDISVKVKYNKDDFNIIIDSKKKRKGFPIILSYPVKPMTIDKKTFDAMSNFEYGHPKPWYKQ